MGINYGQWAALGEAPATLEQAFSKAYDRERGMNREDERLRIQEEGQDKRLAMQMAAQERAAAKSMQPKPAGPTELIKVKNDFEDSAKTYIGARDGWNKVQSAATNPSPAGDISLIFGFMKTIDPTSTVREGEFATAANAGGVPERVRVMYQKALNGERLTPEQRQDFMTQAHNAYKTYEGSYQMSKAQSVKLAKALGIPPDLIITDFEKTAAPMPSVPSAQPTPNPSTAPAPSADPLDKYRRP